MPFSCFPTSFTVFERPFLFSNILFLFSNIFSSYRIAYSVVNRYVTTYINLIRLLTWGATNQDMSLFMKSRLGGCYKTRHVTKRDVLVLATLRYLKSQTIIFVFLPLVKKHKLSLDRWYYCACRRHSAFTWTRNRGVSKGAAGGAIAPPHILAPHF